MLVVPCAKSTMIDKQINHSYEAVALVAKYLKEILHVAHHMDIVSRSAQVADLNLSKEDIEKLNDISELLERIGDCEGLLERLSDVAYTGEYSDLKNVPENSSPLTPEEIDSFMNT